MKPNKVHNKGQARLFKNPCLEMLTKSNPVIIWAIYIPAIVYLIYYSVVYYGFTALFIVPIFISGILSWTLFEYMAHRYLFHWAGQSKSLARLTYVLHGNHHHFPRDRKRLFMPLLPSVVMSLSVFGMMYLIACKYAFIFFPGFITGYLVYASLHYAIHAWHPPFKWMKALWRNHHLHHYTNEEKGFGVSSTLWDQIFGTMFDLKKYKEDKAKTSALMFAKKGQVSNELPAASNF